MREPCKATVLHTQLPIVATNVGGIPELVINNHNGLLVQSQDSDQLAEAIETLITNKALRIWMGQNSRHRVKHNFSLDAEVLNWTSLYSTCLK